MKKKQLIYTAPAALMAENILLVILISLILYFSLSTPSFFSMLNFKNMLIQNSYLIVLTVGFFFIMSSGGIDLSAGYQISLFTVMTGFLLRNGYPTLLIVFVCLLLGIFCGAVNGVIITAFGISPFAATLATQLIFKGISYMISGGTVYPDTAGSFSPLAHGIFLGIPWDVWTCLLCILLTALFFRQTFWGYYIRSVGENEKAARFAGININHTKLACYILGSIFFAAVALIIFSKQGLASPANGIGLEMTGITAVFLGGTTLYSHSKLSDSTQLTGVILGILILIVIENGSQLAGWSQYLQDLIKGIILIGALALNQNRKRLFTV